MNDELPYIRAMANTLHDRGINPLYKDDIKIASALVTAGWPVAMIAKHFEAVKLMVATRFMNEHRRQA